MKHHTTIRKHLRDLRRVIEAPETDLVTKRFAYEIECAIRWARQKTVGWPPPTQMAHDAALMLKQELASRGPGDEP